MSREEYIQSNIDILLKRWSDTALLGGTFLVLSLSLLDYFVASSHFKTFFLYRIVTALFLFLLFLVNKYRIHRSIHHTNVIAASAAVSIMVALMIAQFGGHQSIYFAGIILCIITIIGFIPFTVRLSLLASALMYGIYLVPILVYDTISNRAFFINANVFILSIIVCLILFRFLLYRRMVSELGLQYDLSEKKKLLEGYSQQLEELVAERTKKLETSEQWHRTIFENANDGIVILNTDGVVDDVNKRFVEFYGYERDAIQGNHFALIETSRSQKDINAMIKNLLRGETSMYESIHRKKDGGKISVEISAKAITINEANYIQLLIRDITEKKKLQAQLCHSQKMESIGTLTGGIAHDFNNALAAILGYSDLIKIEWDTNPELTPERNEIIGNAARKAMKMVSKLLSFSRKGPVEKAPLNFNETVADTLKMLRRIIDRAVEIDEKLDETIPVIVADPNQMEQVIMNLVVNAKDAMPEGGKLTIQTELTSLEKNSLDIGTDIEPGNYIHFSVSDTGVGIYPQDMHKIFDPFFTTKGKGKGTGLGLATVYGIVKDHDGYITVESEVGKGSAFHIYLPATPAVEQKPVETTALPLHGDESILLIEDERDILDLAKQILDKHGYNVIATTEPLNGVKIYETMHRRIDLLITDMIMPDMNGKQVIEAIRTIDRDARVLVISGYADQILEGTRLRIDGFLKKPFDSVQFLQSVRRILDRKGAKLKN